MTIQATAGLLSAIGIAGIAGVFLWVARGAPMSAPHDSIVPTATRVRQYLFVVLLLLTVVVSGATLPHLPYGGAAAARDPVIVDVTGRQWAWEVSRQTVEAGRPVVFRVSSADVNHGFALYDDDNRVLAQVQAMPGYVNELAVQFDRPGTYRILCLEYCGLAHHAMVASIVATEASAGEH